MEQPEQPNVVGEIRLVLAANGQTQIGVRGTALQTPTAVAKLLAAALNAMLNAKPADPPPQIVLPPANGHRFLRNQP